MKFLVVLGCLTTGSCPIPGSKQIKFEITAKSLTDCHAVVAKGITDRGYKPAGFSIRCTAAK